LLQHYRSNYAAEIGQPARLSHGHDKNLSLSSILNFDTVVRNQILMLQFAAA
jgi:hypothetical protein